MSAEIYYEEIKMPDHHKILTSNNLIAAMSEAGEFDIYGTSTIIDILEKDGNVDTLTELKKKIEETNESVRSILTEMLKQDDLAESKDYEKNTLFDITELCKWNRYILLLPFTVSEDTFNILYPFYDELVKLHSNYKDRYQQEEVKTTAVSDDFFASYFKPAPKIVYTKTCFDYVKAVKEYIRFALSNDDYIINSYKYISSAFNYKGDLAKRLVQIAEENEVGKMCRRVINDIKQQYKQYYTFDEVRENGIKYKVIPTGFLFYRSYPSVDPPFPKKRPYVFVGFSFLDIVSYSTPQEQDFIDSDLAENSYDYCKLLGNVSTLRLKKELKLLDLNDTETVKSLRQIMEPNVQKSFDKGWILEDDIVNRRSNFKDDAIVAQWIYDNNYDGYIGYGIPGLHDECCISSIKALQHLEEPIKGMGLKFPLEILASFSMKKMVPICRDPFTKINYRLASN